MQFKELGISGAYTIRLEPREDERGKFMRTYCKREFSAIGFAEDFVQMNHTVTRIKGTARGLHYQSPPHAEQKLIRCVRGSVFDVVVDLRKGSSSFLKWEAVELSPANDTMILIPQGCAHGFQALENDCELVYAHTAYYSPADEGGVRADDPAIGIRWPLALTHMSDRDLTFPRIEKSFEGIKI